MSIQTASAYHDIHGLSDLRSQAREAPGESLRETAAQFESIFVRMMLDSMRDATVRGGLFDSSQLETFQQMFDQQLSLDLSLNGGLGLAEILVEQLGAKNLLQSQAGADQPSSAASSTRLDIERQIKSVQAVDTGAFNPAMLRAARPAPAVTEPETASPQAGPASPEEFIHAVRDHAVQAAAELGVDPAVLVAQSALETGWGSRLIRTESGQSSHNLFGIKADARWRGPAATVNTLEYRDGVAAMERHRFRAYDSLAGAFTDYVEFLKSNPRYQQALAEVGDARAFLEGLQTAGYATDPEYADKIMSILDNDRYGDLLDGLKFSAKQPLSG